jgi:hypothetical protein
MLFDALDRARGPALRMAISLLVVVAALWVTLPGQTAFARHGHVYRPPQVYYSGVDTGLLAGEIAPIWPQLDGPYCGIATAMAMVNFDDELRHQPLRFTSRDDQSTIATANQTAGKSRWGYATPTNAVAGITNIAPDFGTDSRAISYDVAT